MRTRTTNDHPSPRRTPPASRARRGVAAAVVAALTLGLGAGVVACGSSGSSDNPATTSSPTTATVRQQDRDTLQDGSATSEPQQDQDRTRDTLHQP